MAVEVGAAGRRGLRRRLSRAGCCCVRNKNAVAGTGTLFTVSAHGRAAG
jgi:hypothetical protein